MTKQRQLLQTVHTKLGDLLAFAALNTGVPVQDIDNIVVLLRMARQDEPESFNPVAKRLRDVAEMPWIIKPSEKQIRQVCALGANEINRILGIEGPEVVAGEVEDD